MSETKQVNLRLNQLSLEQLEELAKRYNMTKTELIIIAIDRLYMEETPRKSKTLPPK